MMVGLKVEWFVVCGVFLGVYVLRGAIVHRFLRYNISVFFLISDN